MDKMLLDLIEHMSEMVTENRLALFKRVLADRTRYLALVLEDIYQSQNASAVLRTCDCVGIQDVHIVEERNTYEVDREVALGADQWLSLHYYKGEQDNISRAVSSLRRKGYRICATTPNNKGKTPENLDLEKGKVALMFGTELNGLSNRALELADECIQIPMVGFTESFNISVSAAITLYSLRKRLEDLTMDWKLSGEEQNELLLNWLRTSIKMSVKIENQFIKNYRSDF
jgi:tRNA (guanosine-2'-O-)-methyltransferase